MKSNDEEEQGAHWTLKTSLVWVLVYAVLSGVLIFTECHHSAPVPPAAKE